MTEETQVIRACLDHLYSRITSPLASDQARYRVAKKALEKLADDTDPPSQFDITDMTIAQAQAAVEGAKITPQQALDQERGGSNRKTLVSWLEERT